MKRILLCALTAAAVSVSSFAQTATGDQSAEAAHQERMQHWAADHETMMDARLGGMKAALKLTPEQNPLWEAFENAVRGGARSRMDDMRQMMENRERMSPVDRLDAMSDHMARRADELKKISQAAKPFYGSLDDTQKRKFGLLSGEMMMALMIIGAVVFFCRDRRWVVWLMAAGGLIGVALVAAETRSMWAGAGCGGVYLLWFWRRWTVIALPVLAGILFLVNPFGIGDRERSVFHPHGDEDSNAHRTVVHDIGWAMIKAHPWLGVGPEQVGKVYKSYVPANVKKLPSGYYQHLHNVYIHYAAERGVPTMLMLVWFLLRALYDFVRTLRRLPADAETRWILQMGIAVIIAIMVAAWEEVNLGTSVVLGMFLAVVGCGYAVIYPEPQSFPSSDPR